MFETCGQNRKFGVFYSTKFKFSLKCLGLQDYVAFLQIYVAKSERGYDLRISVSFFDVFFGVWFDFKTAQ